MKLITILLLILTFKSVLSTIHRHHNHHNYLNHHQHNKRQLNSNNIYRFDPIIIKEEPLIGELIVDLASKLNIHDLAKSDYTFRFYSPSSLTSHYFLIDQLTGHVKTQRSLDREYLCETNACGPCGPINSNCSLPVEIVAIKNNLKSNSRNGGGGGQKFVSFDVIIEDKNEFAPQFPKSIIELNVSEAAPVNFTIPLDAAIDRDSRQTIINYSLLPSFDYPDLLTVEKNQKEIEFLKQHLQLKTTMSTNSRHKLNLILIEPFDYEQIKEIKFRIVASDGTGDMNSLSSKCDVTLKIIDINDNLPKFDKELYEYRLDESEALYQKSLIRVHATDADDGLNGLVKYSLVDQSFNLVNEEVNIESLFKIDETTGWISVAAAKGLDYEQMSTFRFGVRAQDNGLTNSMPVYTSVIIYLNDINDNPPVLTFSIPSTMGTNTDQVMTNDDNNEIVVNISEWTSMDTFIAQIIVNDADSGENGRVNLNLEEKRLKSQITKPNDVMTTFLVTHLFNNIYSLQLNVNGGGLDREKYDEYILEINANDFGTNPGELRSKLRIIIKIDDENDNSPIFQPVQLNNYSNWVEFDQNNGTIVKSYNFRINEIDGNSNKNNEWLKVGQVLATDNDSAKYGTVRYYITSLDNENKQDNESLSNSFRIDPRNGQIWATNVALDYEKQTFYKFKVIASDGDMSDDKSVVNSCSCDIFIYIEDVNDNIPLFESDAYTFEIEEEDERVLALGRLIAFDKDKKNTSNSIIKYSLRFEDDNLYRFFSIDPFSGDLLVLQPLDYEKTHFFKFEAIATDGDGLKSTCTINVNVLDVNDNEPKIVEPLDRHQPFIFMLDNKTQLKTLDESDFYLFKINATDEDSLKYGTIRFQIENQFKIDKTIVKSPHNTIQVGRLLRQKRQFENNKIQHNNLFRIHRLNGQVSLRPRLINETLQLNDNLNSITGLYAITVRITDEITKNSKADTFGTRGYFFIAIKPTVETLNSSMNLNSQIDLIKR
jgi:hypothetical protein